MITNMWCDYANNSGNFKVQVFSPEYPPFSTTGTLLDWDFGDGPAGCQTYYEYNTADPIHEYHIAGTFQITSWDVGYWGNCAYLVGCDTKVIIPFAVDWKTDNYCNYSANFNCCS